MSQDSPVDAYIAKAAPFAQPILRHVRAVMHRASPEIAETMKWSMPFFDYRGRPLANMAAFKAHAAFGFWRRDGAGPSDEAAGAMGQFGKLIAIADLPDVATLVAMIHQAMAMIDAGGKTLRPPKQSKPDLTMPGDLQSALDAVPAAAQYFASFPSGAQREYVEWVVEAKQPATRAKRIGQAVEWCAENKRRHWKYQSS
ncbi:MAG: YdeI/OmpD-associated family protein [Sphingomonadales bacterium]